MVRVLCAQRDRFRQRAHELEEENNRLKTELQVGGLPGWLGASGWVLEAVLFVPGVRDGCILLSSEVTV